MRKEDGLLDGASGTGREIDRRTIAKGVAWTVPVVIVATAAPAAAASGDMHVGSAAALGAASGNNGYEIDFAITSHGVAGTLTLSIPSDSAWHTISGSTAVAADGSGIIKLIKKKSRAAQTVTATYSYTTSSGAVVSGKTQAVATPATPA